MKHLLGVLLCILTYTSLAQDQFIEGVKLSRIELRADIEAKNLSYDGSKTTYFQYNDKTQYKGLEIAVFLRNNYYFFFDGSHAQSKVSIEFYDLPSDNPDRIRLYTIKNVSGKKVSISMEGVTEFYAAYGGNIETLSSVYIDYIIKKGEPSRGAITLSLGF